MRIEFIPTSTAYVAFGGFKLLILAQVQAGVATRSNTLEYNEPVFGHLTLWAELDVLPVEDTLIWSVLFINYAVVCSKLISLFQL